MDKEVISTHHPAGSCFFDKNSQKLYSLEGRIVTIGSAPECAVSLPGFPLSHIGHCLYRNGVYVFQKLSDSVLVEVNGIRIGSKHILKHGDNVKIGNIELEYSDHKNVSQTVPDTTNPIDELVSMIYLLLKNRDRDITLHLMTALSRLFRCDAARIVSEDPENGKRFTLVRYPAHAGLDRFSNRAIDWARDASRTILQLRTDWEDSPALSSSLEKNAIGSVICAPLGATDNLKGYLYLDRTGDIDSFTEEDRVFCDKLLPLFTELLENSIERERQKEIITSLQKATEQTSSGIIYRSEMMHHVLSLAGRIAPTDSPVLIHGETGTGKELMARHIHEKSLRKGKAFKAINCGAVPENLIESELFGYEKGAFTGANTRKIGLFEAANGGTVFLDELGEMPLQLQVRLLRVIQESEVLRVGCTEPVKVDIRVVAATNRDLKTEVEEGRFRSDLFFRLNVLSIRVPPLRERSEDILLLAEYFVEKFCVRMGKTAMILTGEARETLAAHLWPGNIRELENVIQKAVVMSLSSKITKEDIEISYDGNAKNIAVQSDRIQTIRAVREQAERELIQKALRATTGNVTHTSRILDIDRKWLITKMTEYGIDADVYRK
jgi:transcriptional regulator with GAF, ATPase, and Fis domain